MYLAAKVPPIAMQMTFRRFRNARTAKHNLIRLPTGQNFRLFVLFCLHGGFRNRSIPKPKCKPCCGISGSLAPPRAHCHLALPLKMPCRKQVNTTPCEIHSAGSPARLCPARLSCLVSCPCYLVRVLMEFFFTTTKNPSTPL